MSTTIRDEFKEEHTGGKEPVDAAARNEAIQKLMDTDVEELARRAFSRNDPTGSDRSYVTTVVWFLPIEKGIKRGHLIRIVMNAMVV